MLRLVDSTNSLSDIAIFAEKKRKWVGVSTFLGTFKRDKILYPEEAFSVPVERIDVMKEIKD